MQFTAALIAALAAPAAASTAAFCGTITSPRRTYAPDCDDKFVQMEIECRALGGTPAGNSIVRDAKNFPDCQTICNQAPAAVEKTGYSEVPDFAVPALAGFLWTASIQKQCSA